MQYTDFTAIHLADTAPATPRDETAYWAQFVAAPRGGSVLPLLARVWRGGVLRARAARLRSLAVRVPAE